MARSPNKRSDPDWRDIEDSARRVLSYETPKELRRFRAGMTLLVSALIVGGLWTGLWFGASKYVQGQLKDFARAEAAQGGAVNYESLDLSGFPSRIVLTLTKPHILGFVAGRKVDWQGDSLMLSTRPWLPWHVHVDAPGNHEVVLVDSRMTFGGDVAKLGADLVLGRSWPERVQFDVEGLNLDGDAVVHADFLAADVIYNGGVIAGGDGLKVDFSGSNITLPLNGGLGLGNTISSVDVGLRVIGPVKSGVLAERLKIWRDVGGAIQFERFQLRDGPLGMAAVGTLALNADMQPVGSFTVKFEGLFQVLEIFRAEGLVSGSDAVLATMALSAFSKRPVDGGQSAINLSMTVQDGKLSLGSVPVITLPTFDWGKAKVKSVKPSLPAERDYKDVPPIY